VFSTALEVVLHIALREAVSRRHAYLTLEHLLYALAHDPEGERILQGCGVDMLRSKNGPLVLEVNSSPGIEGLEKATGIDVATPIIEFLERHAAPNNTRTKGKG